jgi:hypothetical protein
MKFGLLTYDIGPSGKFNVGDHIQSLAAKQYLPKLDSMIKREYLNSLNLKEKTSVIMNGWYTQHPENWPPEELLNPFFVSFHLNSSYAEKILNKQENVQYFKKYEPIGCRDKGTVKYLQKYGIDAYYSSCLTTTLDLKYKTVEKNDDILIVDLLYKDDLKQQYKDYPKSIISDIISGNILNIQKREKTIRSLIPKEILKKAKYLTHTYWGKDYNEEEQFKLGEELLHKYAKAKLVITSRIHVALPCLAFGTPVVFIVGGGLFKESELSRLKGTIEHLNVITTEKISLDTSITKDMNILDVNNIDWDNISNPTSYLKYANKLKEACFSFIDNSEIVR